MPLCCRDLYLVNKYGNEKDMKGKTFVEKVFNAENGSIVFKKPDMILTYDNSASIYSAYWKRLRPDWC